MAMLRGTRTACPSWEKIAQIVSSDVAGISRMAVLEDPRFLEHVGPRGHPERPERLAAVASALAARSEPLARIAPRAADDGELLRIHTPAHLRALRAAASSAPTQLDPDTYLGPRSLSVAELAAGGLIELCRTVVRGGAETGLAALRPPGHHAEADRAMGFCLYNNVAVAARALQAEEGVERVLILDWDVHHGNGTQHVFEDDPSVLYFSTHQFPYYPGTGAFGEAGVGRGRGATVNVPMPAGCGDPEYVGALQRLFAPVARAFRPDVLIVSCGFDAHRDDPLAAMEVSAEGFLAMSAIVRAAADELCGGRVVFALEGGYAPSGLAEGTAAVLEATLRAEAPRVVPVEMPAGSLLRRLVDSVVAVHGAQVPGLGAA
jgi:acetoin utilization deacetylase AcuC-like enzyme